MTIEDTLKNIHERMQNFLDNIPEGLSEPELIAFLAQQAIDDAKAMKSISTELPLGVVQRLKEKQEDRELFKELPTLRRFKKDML